mmetsp:Transcript_8455/g.18952  ORF Transcript_8455/g.18952 Transcript_8455/m.18952 type:complete len:208 (+) Transcript_8455:65-688(+)
MATTIATMDATPISDNTNLHEPPDMDASNGARGEKDDASTASSFLKAVAATELELGDIENQHPDQEEDGDDLLPPSTSSVEKPPPESTTVVTTANVGIFAGDEDDTASVFSFDSYEKQPRIPLRVQNMLRKQHEGRDDPNSSEVPFPSIVGASMEYENVVNVCPCRCLFFTLKETICLIMSALGCAVFLAGLIVLCMYLEGSAFTGD